MLTTIKNLPDNILWGKFRQGNTAAYNILFKRYYDQLYGYALKNLKEAETAEELTMDVMLRLWKKKDDIVIENDLRPYLYRSIKNAIYNHYRKNLLSTVPIELIADTIAQAGNNVDDKLQHAELEKLYQQKLGELSPQRQKVFRMSREENMSYSQIAKDLDLSINTVENYMVASLRFFRKHLKEHADHTVLIIIALFY